MIARSVEDVALIVEALAGHDPADPDTRPVARPPLVRVAAEEPPLPPRLAFAKTPNWADADPSTHEAFDELAGALRDHVVPFDVPEALAGAWEWHRLIMEADLARNFRHEYEEGRDRLSESLRSQIERGRTRETTLYVDPAYEVRAGAAVKYAMLSGRRVARVEGTIDPARERVQRPPSPR